MEDIARAEGGHTVGAEDLVVRIPGPAEVLGNKGLAGSVEAEARRSLVVEIRLAVAGRVVRDSPVEAGDIRRMGGFLVEVRT